MKKGLIIAGFVLAIIILMIVLIRTTNRSSSYACENSDNLISISGKEFQEKIDNKDSFILLIESNTCNICQEFKPILRCTLEENDIEAYSIETDGLSEEERIALDDVAYTTGTPVTVFINDGEETTTLNRIVGKAPQKDIEERFKSLGYIGEDNEK